MQLIPLWPWPSDAWVLHDWHNDFFQINKVSDFIEGCQGLNVENKWQFQYTNLMLGGKYTADHNFVTNGRNSSCIHKYCNWFVPCSASVVSDPNNMLSTYVLFNFITGVFVYLFISFFSNLFCDWLLETLLSALK